MVGDKQEMGYQCPKCNSTKIRVGYPRIECLGCHHSESLIDFPISWDFHRALAVDAGQVDPGISNKGGRGDRTPPLPPLLDNILENEKEQTEPLKKREFEHENASKEFSILALEVLQLKTKMRRYFDHKRDRI